MADAVDDLMNAFSGCSGRFVEGFRRHASEMVSLHQAITDIMKMADKDLAEMKAKREENEKELEKMRNEHRDRMSKFRSSLNEILKNAPPLDKDIEDEEFDYEDDEEEDEKEDVDERRGV